MSQFSTILDLNRSRIVGKFRYASSRNTWIANVGLLTLVGVLHAIAVYGTSSSGVNGSSLYFLFTAILALSLGLSLTATPLTLYSRDTISEIMFRSSFPLGSERLALTVFFDFARLWILFLVPLFLPVPVLVFFWGGTALAMHALLWSLSLMLLMAVIQCMALIFTAWGTALGLRTGLRAWRLTVFHSLWTGLGMLVLVCTVWYFRHLKIDANPGVIVDVLFDGAAGLLTQVKLIFLLVLVLWLMVRIGVRIVGRYYMDNLPTLPIRLASDPQSHAGKSSRPASFRRISGPFWSLLRKDLILCRRHNECYSTLLFCFFCTIIQIGWLWQNDVREVVVKGLNVVPLLSDKSVIHELRDVSILVMNIEWFTWPKLVLAGILLVYLIVAIYVVGFEELSYRRLSFYPIAASSVILSKTCTLLVYFVPFLLVFAAVNIAWLTAGALAGKAFLLLSFLIFGFAAVVVFFSVVSRLHISQPLENLPFAALILVELLLTVFLFCFWGLMWMAESYPSVYGMASCLFFLALYFLVCHSSGWIPGLKPDTAKPLHWRTSRTRVLVYLTAFALLASMPAFFVFTYITSGEQPLWEFPALWKVGLLGYAVGMGYLVLGSRLRIDVKMAVFLCALIALPIYFIPTHLRTTSEWRLQSLGVHPVKWWLASTESRLREAIVAETRATTPHDKAAAARIFWDRAEALVGGPHSSIFSEIGASDGLPTADQVMRGIRALDTIDEPLFTRASSFSWQDQHSTSLSASHIGARLAAGLDDTGYFRVLEYRLAMPVPETREDLRTVDGVISTILYTGAARLSSDSQFRLYQILSTLSAERLMAHLHNLRDVFYQLEVNTFSASQQRAVLDGIEPAISAISDLLTGNPKHVNLVRSRYLNQDDPMNLLDALRSSYAPATRLMMKLTVPESFAALQDALLSHLPPGFDRLIPPEAMRVTAEEPRVFEKLDALADRFPEYVIFVGVYHPHCRSGPELIEMLKDKFVNDPARIMIALRILSHRDPVTRIPALFPEVDWDALATLFAADLDMSRNETFYPGIDYGSLPLTSIDQTIQAFCETVIHNHLEQFTEFFLHEGIPTQLKAAVLSSLSKTPDRMDTVFSIILELAKTNPDMVTALTFQWEPYIFNGDDDDKSEYAVLTLVKAGVPWTRCISPGYLAKDDEDGRRRRRLLNTLLDHGLLKPTSTADAWSATGDVDDGTSRTEGRQSVAWRKFDWSTYDSFVRKGYPELAHKWLKHSAKTSAGARILLEQLKGVEHTRTDMYKLLRGSHVGDGSFIREALRLSYDQQGEMPSALLMSLQLSDDVSKEYLTQGITVRGGAFLFRDALQLSLIFFLSALCFGTARARREPLPSAAPAAVPVSKPYPTIGQAVLLLICTALLMQVLPGLFLLAGIEAKKLVSAPVIGVVNIVSFAAILMWGTSRTGRPYSEVFPLRPFSIQLVAPIFITIVGIGILSSELDNLLRLAMPYPAVIQELLAQLMNEGFGTLFVIVVVAPLTEEFLFRGLLLRGFLMNYGKWTAILVSSALFALFHMNPYQFAAAFTMGILLAWLYTETKSLWTCILAHALVNGHVYVAGYILHIEIPGYTTGDLSTVELQPLWFDIMGVFLLAAGLAWLVRSVRSSPSVPLHK